MTDKELGLTPNDGFTMMGWFQVRALTRAEAAPRVVSGDWRARAQPLALPTSAKGATIMKWRWGEVRLQMDGSVALCDTSSCTASSVKVTVGGDEKNW